jgi:hypothetical protein
MTQKICPHCHCDNDLDNDYCGRCGTRLDTPLVRHAESPLVIGDQARLPAPLVRQAVRAAAVSLLALAAEAGLTWLRRRAESAGPPAVLRPRPVQKEQNQPPAPSGTTIFSRRVVQIWEQGRLRGQGVEETVWRWNDEV